MTLAVPTYQSILNDALPGDARIGVILNTIKHGDMLQGVRSKKITLSAQPYVDLLTVDTTAAIPPATPGGLVDVTAGTIAASATASGHYVVSGTFADVVAAAGITIAGADANGDITVTPKSTAYNESLRFGIINLGLLSRAMEIFVMENEVWLLTGTDGAGAIDATKSSATLAVAALRANAAANALFTYGIPGTGASAIGQRKLASPLPSIRVAGPPIQTGPGRCLMSNNGKRLLFHDTLTGATLNWNAGPAALLSTMYQEPQPR